jgi:hypothetical protein
MLVNFLFKIQYKTTTNLCKLDNQFSYLGSRKMPRVKNSKDDKTTTGGISKERSTFMEYFWAGL